MVYATPEGGITPAASPPSVDQPGAGAMLGHLVCQHAGVLHRVPHEECPTKAGAEGGLRFRHALFCARHLLQRG